MNKIYLFGKVISKSKLKYILKPKLKVYMEFVIETIDKNIFDCIAEEDKCDMIIHVNKGDFVYVEGFARIDNVCLKKYIDKIHV